MRLNRMWIVGLVVTLVLLATLSCSFVDSLLGSSEPPIELAGVWFNPVTHSETTIVWENDQFEAVSVVDMDDGEVYPITDSDWDGARIRWSYYVPSTDYNVTFTMESLEGDILNCSWFNDHQASGTRALRRQ
jgi:hypothetical protein